MTSTAADRGREVRHRLLRAAAELIAERGWTAVSTRVVAERAGVAPGLVHYHFASVQALLSAAATGAIRESLDAVGPMLTQARTPAELVELSVASLDSFTGDDPVSVLFIETYLAATRDPRLRDAVAAILADFRERYAAWFGAHGVAAPEATAVVLGSAFDGLVMRRALDSTLTAEAIAPVLTRMLTPASEKLGGNA
ncbi:TetR family transcriptional regulator [Prauserella marina]|uniref:DNA-binding transcriptional regulator YbjK n=1 Tax=Prauserella marina TaxID=530584 RepID=A0A222VW96_9PSEU|nr:TetR/AcrR family transcriptional regulator [Prauserella marina]ASR38102.1 TetR family transcriptional regulator [Prauserella marina]PWV78740.1 TetR family transcriptional regulator [Prauserella marina]SDC92590.1 DNA-binding transcriptional regulator YbjK [Prauserella marina]